MPRSRYFSRLVRGVAHQRFALLKQGGSSLFYPPAGSPWVPNRVEQSLSDAFIFFVTAELESYFEAVLAELFSFHELCSQGTPSAILGSHDKMHGPLLAMKKKLARNNHTRWEKMEELWKFVGLRKSMFPNQFWDHVEAISTYRGDVAHQGWKIRSFTDPRIIFRHVEELIPLLRRFDRDFLNCRSRQRAYLALMGNQYPEFVPGLGTITPQQLAV